MAEFEYTPREDARYDHLTDVENKDAHEARSIIELERQEAERRQRHDDEVRKMGIDAAARFIQAPEVKEDPQSEEVIPADTTNQPKAKSGRKFHYHGGKIRDADSALDPNWNVPTLHDSSLDTPETIEAQKKFVSEAREDTIRSLVRSGLSQIEAEARMRAHHEIIHRN